MLRIWFTTARFIALAGVAAQTGVIMLIYLDHALEARATARRRRGKHLMSATCASVRSKRMTVIAIMAGPLPILWNTGTLGSDASYRCADGGWHGVLHRAYVNRDSCALFVHQAAPLGTFHANGQTHHSS